MVESKVFRVVSLDEVVDSDAFRLEVLAAACAIPTEWEDPMKNESEQA